MATAGTPLQPRLQDNVRTEVCIIGAGIAGLTTAYLLSREGRSVVVLDDGAIGGGMTGRTTAHLTNAFDDRYTDVEKLHGEEGARFTAESHTAAIDKVEMVCRRLRSIATRTARFTGVQPSARTSGASSRGTPVKRLGIVRVMVRNTVPKAAFTRDRQTRT